MAYPFQTSRHDATHFSKGRKLDYAPNMTKFTCFSNFLNLPTKAAARPLRIYLPISGVLKLQIKRGWICWKANIPGYNSLEPR
jgi:hypothetical protein